MPKDVFKKMWQTIGRGDMFRGIIKNRAKDGTPYYVDAVIAPDPGRERQAHEVPGRTHDITEAEIERQNARGILAAIDASYAYIEFELDGTVIDANRNFLQLLGYQPEEVRPPPPHVRRRRRPTPAYAEFWRQLNAGRPRRTRLPPLDQGRRRGLDPGRLRASEGRDGPREQDRQDRHRRDREVRATACCAKPSSRRRR